MMHHVEPSSSRKLEKKEQKMSASSFPYVLVDRLKMKAAKLTRYEESFSYA